MIQAMTDKKTIRCAIYTRKSHEEGLEQEFNSLDAQREAAEAYIASQRHAGWVALPTDYSDGGYTGGTTERPAFQKLLADIEHDRIDCVVVYKVDRLTEPDLGENVVAVYTYDGVNPASLNGELRRASRRVSKAVAVRDACGTLTGYDRTDYEYDEAWQVLEERLAANACSAEAVATAPHAQYVWDLRYIDAPVLRIRDTAGPSCGEPDGDLDDAGDEVLYYTTDANMNVTALVNPEGEVVERYAYDAYGAPTILNGVKDACGTDTSESEWDERTVATFQNEVLFAGYRYNYETGNFHVRNREYSSALGRWLQEDPLGYIDGMNSYEYAQGGPTGKVDPGGTTIKLFWAEPPCSEEYAEHVVQDDLLENSSVDASIVMGSNLLILKGRVSCERGNIDSQLLGWMIESSSTFTYSGRTIEDALDRLRTDLSGGAIDLRTLDLKTAKCFMLRACIQTAMEESAVFLDHSLEGYKARLAFAANSLRTSIKAGANAETAKQFLAWVENVRLGDWSPDPKAHMMANGRLLPPRAGMDPSYAEYLNHGNVTLPAPLAKGKPAHFKLAQMLGHEFIHATTGMLEHWQPQWQDAENALWAIIDPVKLTAAMANTPMRRWMIFRDIYKRGNYPEALDTIVTRNGVTEPRLFERMLAILKKLGIQ